MIQTDTLLNGLQIEQDTERFMYGIDAVLLANFAASFIYPKDSVIDLGTGNGIIPLLLSTQCKAASITGLEIQTESAELASQSVHLNNLEERICIVNGDLKKADELFAKHSFKVVCSNPPYMLAEQGKNNPDMAKAIARHEVLCNLEDIIKAVDFLLATHGRFFMIHRPSRLAEIFSILLKYKIEPKRLRLVHPAKDKNANLVLIEARKNASSELITEPPLFVYARKGEYSDEMKEIFSELTKK